MCCIKNNTKSNGITDFNSNETCNSIKNIDTGENYHQKCYAIHDNILHRENAIIIQLISNISIYTTAATSGAGTAYSSGESEFTPGFCWGSCYTISSFMCKLLQIVVCSCVIFLWAIVLPVVLRFTAADYLFGIFSSS